ncbi:MAG: molybdopterin-dependent oxidoreductase [Pseudomonadota bacterium]|nr:molybdopterin-dependent oxidoreductase [Pseudomonadota bacterium]
MSNALSRRGFLRGTLGAAAVGGAIVDRALAESLPPVAPSPAPPSAGAPGTETTSVRTVVNGRAESFDVGPDDTALHVVRERLGLTGTKEACGHGACGACAIHVDGTPVASCLLPATALAGHAVTTIEGLGAPSAASAVAELHPVQRAFIAEDALQCGFCTPGFVMEAVAFHDRWRREQTRPPTEDEVAAALAGHLCRCGAYPSIRAAVIGACSGLHDGADPVAPRHEAREKVTGRAIYTVDVKRPGQLEGRTLRSPHANAIVRRIDLTAALAAPGVKAAIAFVEVGGRVRYAGQEIAAVAATDWEHANAALKLIAVEYEVGVPAVGIAAALAPGAAPVYEVHTKDLPLHFEGVAFSLPWEGNRRGPLDTSFLARPARARKAVADPANTVVRARYVTQAQVHTALEPHACVAEWEGDKKLHVWLSTQGCSAMAEDLADRLDLKREDVHVNCEHVGGAFGAKLGYTPETELAVRLAREARAPVRMVNDRAEEMVVGGYRPGMDIDIALAATPEGAPAGMVLTGLGDGGVSVGATNGLMARLLYPDLPKSLEDYDILSHAPPGKAFRGPGGPQGIFAIEQAMDALAVARSEDPITLRRRWDPNPIRAMLYDTAEAHPLWTGRGARDAATRDTGRYRRGVGLAVGTWYYLFSPGTQVRLDLADGQLVASCGAQDMGNGARTVLATAVADIFGLAPADIVARLGHSEDVHGVPSGGSRTTASVGPAAQDAARQLREELVGWARRGMGLVRPVAGPDGVRHEGGLTSWRDVMASSPPVTTIGRRRLDEEGLQLGAGPDVALGKRLPGALQMTEVEVDTRLGRVTARRVWIGIGVGRIWVPALAKSQVEGAVVQGLGFALYEERRLDPRTGRALTLGLEDYRLPGLGDIPQIEVHFEERGFEHVNGLGVGLAELSTVPTAASVANAVHAATGWRPLELPIRPDRVITGVAS